MTNNQKKNVAESLDLYPTLDLYPWFDYLLQDLWSLGSEPETLVDILRPRMKKNKIKKALDIGCGKGAVAVTLAREFGLRATGLDAYPPFVKTAREKADFHQVGHLCDFIEGDMVKKISSFRNYNLVIFASVGSVLGNFAQSLGELRKTIKKGGLVLYDDGFKKTTSAGDGHFASHPDQLEARKQLTSYGDIILEERISPDEFMKEINSNYIRDIEKRAAELSVKYPEKTQLFTKYVANQNTESAMMEKDFTSCTWLIEKRGK